jgi:hypothetical protein
MAAEQLVAKASIYVTIIPHEDKDLDYIQQEVIEDLELQGYGVPSKKNSCVSGVVLCYLNSEFPD